MSEPRWRVGRKLGRTLYLDGECVGMMDTPALAKRIVDTMNRAEPVELEVETWGPFDQSEVTGGFPKVTAEQAEHLSPGRDTTEKR